MEKRIFESAGFKDQTIADDMFFIMVVVLRDVRGKERRGDGVQFSREIQVLGQRQLGRCRKRKEGGD